MKQPTYIFLLTAALAVLSWTAFAHEATTESESGAPAAEAAQTVAASESIDLAMLDFPLVPDFQVAEGGTCTPCSNHGQCAVACGGSGVCLRDLGGECGSFPQDKYCFC